MDTGRPNYYRIVCRCCGKEAVRHVTARSRMCDPCMNARTKERLAATAEVTKAVRNGLLPSPKTLECADCGNPARDYDHRDYSKPLEVEAVCHSCNIRRPLALDSRYRKAA
jgi:hypothetical protein